MAKEAERRAEAGLDMTKLNFFASDLESLSGSFHGVLPGCFHPLPPGSR